MKNTNNPGRKAATLGKSVAVGAGVGVAVWAGLLLCASAIISGLATPENYILPAVFVLAALSAFAAGGVSGRFCRSVLLPGISTGAVLVALVFVLSLACSGSNTNSSSPVFNIILCIDFVFFALLGAKIAVPSAAKPKRRTRHG